MVTTEKSEGKNLDLARWNAIMRQPAWYDHPDKCGGGSRSGYRCASWSKTKSPSSQVKCKKWVKAVKKCGGKKSSRKKTSRV